MAADFDPLTPDRGFRGSSFESKDDSGVLGDSFREMDRAAVPSDAIEVGPFMPLK
jgi:hypothetical protein